MPSLFTAAMWSRSFSDSSLSNLFQRSLRFWLITHRRFALRWAGLYRPDRPDQVFAFRVFDTGTFEGRQHNVGIVGVVLPRLAERGWPLSALLERLPTPAPGAEDYLLQDTSNAN